VSQNTLMKKTTKAASVFFGVGIIILLLSIPIIFSNRQGHILISSNVEGTNIIINGKKSFQTPFSGKLDPQIYNIILSKDGYESQEKIIVIGPGEVKSYLIHMEKKNIISITNDLQSTTEKIQDELQTLSEDKKIDRSVVSNIDRQLSDLKLNIEKIDIANSKEPKEYETQEMLKNEIQLLKNENLALNSKIDSNDNLSKLFWCSLSLLFIFVVLVSCHVYLTLKN